MNLVTTTTLRTTKLIMVTAANNNKYYEMYEQPNATFKVHYGRVGGTQSVATYTINRWDEKYREKVAKGYVDQTHLFAEKAQTTSADHIANQSVRGLMTRLMDLANRSIFQNYVVSAQQVTRKQVDQAQQLLDQLAAMVQTNLDPTRFNEQLLALFKTIPRKMTQVNDHLVKQAPQSGNEVQALRDQLAREQDTLDVMRGQVELNQSTTPDAPPPCLLQTLNLTVEPVDNDRVLKLIKQMMGTDFGKFDAAFAVKQSVTESAFDSFVSNQPNRKTQLLWHGSRSENWMSILKSGLMLRPANAIITGKMFGYGVYFADEFSKSLNYTSLHGSTWARSNQQEGFLAIYEVHVGNQLTLTKHEGWHMQLDSDKLKAIKPDYDSVFARRGFSLLKNEYIVYNSAQSTIRYLVRIKI